MSHDPYAAARLPQYRWFAGGFACSSTGLQMLAMAVGWEVYERTNDEFLLGYTGLARALPVMLLALPAGQLTDIFSRKWVLVISQAAFAFFAVLLAVGSFTQAPLWTIYILLALTGCARAFNGPARGALLPQIVPASVFTNAVTWNSGVFHFSACIGPLIAGGIIRATGAAWPVYAATAALTAAMAISTAFIREGRDAGRPRGKFALGDMLGGLSHLGRDRVLLGAVLIDCLGVLFGGAMILLPVYAKDILHVGPEGLGALRAAPYAGAVGMAIVLAHRRPFTRAGRAFLVSVALWAVGIILFGLSGNFWLSLVLLAFQGAVDNISVVIRHVLVQMRTPEHLRGRVGAVNSMFIEISNEMGGFESGVVAGFFGPVFSVVSGGAITLVIVAAIGALIPGLRRLGSLDEHVSNDTAPK
jgi:MFS family permease